MDEQNSATEVFIDKVKREVSAINNESRSVSSDRNAFPCWVLIHLDKLEIDEAINNCDTISNGDYGLDGYFFDPETETLKLYQTKFPDDPTSRVDASSIIEINNAFTFFKEPAQNDLSETQREVHLKIIETIELGHKIELIAVVFGFFTDNAIQRKDSLQAELDRNYNNVLLKTIDLDDLYSTEVTESLATGLENIEVTIKLFGRSKIEIPGEDLGQFCDKAALLNLDALSLGRAVNNNYPGIYSRNVRYNLAVRNKVNTSMRELLADRTKRKNFWNFNNGITLVADDFRFENDDSNNSTKVIIRNPQIVNGCQTTTAIKDSLQILIQEFGNDSSFPICCKLSAVQNSDDGSLFLNEISDKSNSQTAVKVTNLRSNHTFLIQLQNDFSNLEEPWFYERKEREWATLTRAQKGRFDNRRVNFIKVAQTWRAFSGEPSQAINSKNSMFEDQTLFNRFFNPSNVNPEKLLFAFYLYENLNEIVKNNPENVERREAMGLDYFDDDFLPKIERAKSLWVSHMIAIFLRIYEEQEGTSFDRIKAYNFLRIMNDNQDAFKDTWKILINAYMNWHRPYLAQADFDLLSELKKENTFEAIYRTIRSNTRGMNVEIPFPDLNS